MNVCIVEGLDYISVLETALVLGMIAVFIFVCGLAVIALGKIADYFNK